MPDKNWQFELEEYIRQGEPDRAEKSEAWQTAIGLQAVDGLKTSAYLLDTAKDHIEGKITIDEAQQRIHSYYEQRTTRTEIENETKEADIVSARIAKLLGEKAFQFSPAEWLSIHRRLFEGVFSHAGQIRQYNITKKEWVLNGDTVTYADWNSIKDTLDYDFATEKQFSYEGLSVDAAVKHLAKFASDIWQIHPFGEGNTRATAVFMIKYMKTFGFRVNNDAFEKNSWYFRNALVRANYTNLQKGVHSTTKFLEMFFSNLLLGTDYELKNPDRAARFADGLAERGHRDMARVVFVTGQRGQIVKIGDQTGVVGIAGLAAAVDLHMADLRDHAVQRLQARQEFFTVFRFSLAEFPHDDMTDHGIFSFIRYSKFSKISTVPSAMPSGSSASATSVVPPVSFSSTA